MSTDNDPPPWSVLSAVSDHLSGNDSKLCSCFNAVLCPKGGGAGTCYWRYLLLIFQIKIVHFLSIVFTMMNIFLLSCLGQNLTLNERQAKKHTDGSISSLKLKRGCASMNLVNFFFDNQSSSFFEMQKWQLLNLTSKNHISFSLWMVSSRVEFNFSSALRLLEIIHGV